MAIKLYSSSHQWCCWQNGPQVVKAVAQAEDMTLVGAIDRSPEHQGKDAGELAGLVNRWKFQY